VKGWARGQKQENYTREVEAGQSKEESRAKNKGEDRDGDRDDGGGKNVEVLSIYLSKMNK
jgi:hypothetical protein